ncbi:Na+/H+ antiporter subunit E [Desulfonatronovibrio hydrogenovorans]|uniref:Na+/H+ antiporter subunit E n=1 Tax=Desulfonatronovibrio hydrogenovorans TaxID=53245 RepID=UPI00068D0C96|nr:Na+/H+ antiporter subunit E [Desulfonatronovibrio hydrogenovorans]
MNRTDSSRLFSGYGRTIPFLKSVLLRWFIFGIIWWGLSEGQWREPWAAFFFISAAALLSALLVPFQKISLRGLLSFIPFFVHLSIMGGIDVASRAIRPSMPLRTGFFQYSISLEHPTARVIFIWVVSLLPGTASVQLKEDLLQIHVLDRQLSHQKRLHELEEHIKSLFRN